MYVHSVKLVNYKSFGDYPENEIILEPDVTAIIGKNESGKSNIVNGLSGICLGKNINKLFSVSFLNRNCSSEAKISYVFTLKPSSIDKTQGISGDTILVSTKEKQLAKGSFVEYYYQSIYPSIEEVFEILGDANKNPLNVQGEGEFSNFRSCYILLNKEETIDILKIESTLEFLRVRAQKADAEKREILKSAINDTIQKWHDYLQIFPIFFERKSDKHLQSAYGYDDIKKELSETDANNSFLSEFIGLLGIDKEDFLFASRSGSDPRQASIRSKINRLIDSNINQPFHNFYHTEKIRISLDFNNGSVSFVIQSNDGSALVLSERSNGLRWYLETYIDVLANNLEGKNVVFLIDEPGTSLHVNAQRELLKLFRHLADHGNQVVYTTHSPYLLDTDSEGIHKIRAVVKDINGYSRIYKTAYDARIAPESQQDTLAPVINALGMNLNDTFGPAKDKINIVTEGISDYIYLITMAKVLKIDLSKYTIIPSVGATNSINICMILHGWGCRYIALFDFDKEGVESGGNILQKNLLFEYKKQYCYVEDVSMLDIEERKYNTEKVMIEDVMGQSEIERFIKESGNNENSKALTAKLMCSAIERGNFVLDEESKRRFNALFERILSYCQ